MKKELELNKNHFTKENISISLEMGGGSIKEKFVSSIPQYESDIRSDTEIVLFTPDMGKRDEKDEYFVPNIHNGLFRIHAFLCENNVNSVLLCTDIYNTEKAFELIEKYKPPLIAFSPYYDTMQNDLNNISQVRKISPNSTIIVGGIEASLNPQWNTFGELVDILIRGEGEFSLLELIKRYRNFSNKEFSKKSEFLNYLRNSFSDKKISGALIVNTDKSFTPEYIERIDNESYQKINIIAFQKQLSISPIEKYWKLSREMFGGKKDTFFRFVSSSHCPRKCVFCQSSIYSSTILGKSQVPILYVTAENVMKIIRTVPEQYSFIKDIYLDDDDFFIHRNRALKILEAIIQDRKEGKPLKNITFHCKTRTDNINQENCKLLKEAGFKTVSLGSESYSAIELKYMNKNNSAWQNLKAIKILIEGKIHIAENYILCTPITTKDTFYENVSQICHNIGEFNIDGGATLFLTPLPGTKLCGNEEYETIREFPYKQGLFQEKIMFRNPQTGYEYIGKEIIVPETNAILPHPEILLPNNPLIRKALLDSLLYLPETIKEFKEIVGEINLSRSFITLANIWTASKVLYKLTNEQRWDELNKYIIKIVVKSNERRNKE